MRFTSVQKVSVAGLGNGGKYTVHRETTFFPLQTKITIVGMMESNKVSLAIAKICDGCFFGACHDIKSRSK